MKKEELIKIAKAFANNANMPYCWEDVYNRLISQTALPFNVTVEDDSFSRKYENTKMSLNNKRDALRDMHNVHIVIKPLDGREFMWTVYQEKNNCIHHTFCGGGVSKEDYYMALKDAIEAAIVEFKI